METSCTKTAYHKKLAEVKKKYFPLLEKLIRTEKTDKFKAVYSALDKKKLTIECLLKFEAILEKVDTITKQSAVAKKYSDTGQNRGDISGSGEITFQADCLKCTPSSGTRSIDQEDLKTACIPLIEEKPDQCTKINQQVVHVEPLQQNSINIKKLSKDLIKRYTQQESSSEAVNVITNTRKKISSINKHHKNSDFIEVEVIKEQETRNSQKPTNELCLNTLVPRVRNENLDKVNDEKSYIEKNLSNSYVRKETKNYLEIKAVVGGTSSIKEVNVKESQYLNVKEINQSSLYYQVSRDKMMLNSQLANMKRGTVFDLVDKNSRRKGHPYTIPLSSHTLAKSQTSSTIPTSDQYHERASTVHKESGTKIPSTKINILLNKPLRIANLIDEKMYDNLKSAVTILGFNADPTNQITSEFNEDKCEPVLQNNIPPLSKKHNIEGFVPASQKEQAPPQPPLPPQEPTTQNVQFSCNVTLPPTNALTHNWYQNPYNNAPGLKLYQPTVCCGSSSQNSLLPSSFPRYNPNIATHSIPVVCNEPDGSYCNRVVPPNSDPSCCSSCYHSSYGYNQIRISQAHDIPSNSTRTANGIYAQNNNPFYNERYASNDNEKHLNNHDCVKKETYYDQRYQHKYSKSYTLHKYDRQERRLRINRRNERNYFEWQKNYDCSFVKGRQSLRDKYSYRKDISRKKNGDEKLFVRSKSSTNFHSVKTPTRSGKELKNLRVSNDKIRPWRDPRDQSKFFDTNKSNSKKRNEYLNTNDKESYVSPLNNLYGSSDDLSFQSVNKKHPFSNQQENKQVKKALKGTDSKAYSKESDDEKRNNCSSISNLEEADMNNCMTEKTRGRKENSSKKAMIKKNRNLQNTIKNKCVNKINLTKQREFDHTILNSKKSYIPETSSTVCDAKIKLHKNMLVKKHLNLFKPKNDVQKPLHLTIVNNNQVPNKQNIVSETNNVKPFKTSKNVSDQQTTSLLGTQRTFKRKFNSFNNTSNTHSCSTESDSDLEKPDGKRMKCYNKFMVAKKPNAMVKLCHEDQPISVSCTTETIFEVECSNDHSTNEFHKLLSTNTSALKIGLNKSRVVRKKFVRKRVKVICSDSDSNNEAQELNKPTCKVKKEKVCKQPILSKLFFKKPRKRGSGIITQEFKNLEKNEINDESGRKKVVTFVNEADDIKVKDKKTCSKAPVKKKTFTNLSVPQKFVKTVHGSTNKSISNSEKTESSDPNTAYQKDREKETTKKITVKSSLELKTSDAENLVINKKKTLNKMPEKKKTSKNLSLQHKSSKTYHECTNKIFKDLDKTTSDFNISCQEESDEETMNENKVVNCSHVKTSDNINVKGKKTMLVKKKSFTNCSLSHKSTNTVVSHENTQSSDLNMAYYKDSDKKTMNPSKIVNSLEEQYKKAKLWKALSNHQTDTGCKEKSETPENDENKCSLAEFTKTSLNQAQLVEKGIDEPIVSTNKPDIVVDKIAEGNKTHLSFNSSRTMEDLFQNVKDMLKPEAVQAFCQLISLFGNSQENVNTMQLGNIFGGEQKDKDENQIKINYEDHTTNIGNDKTILGDSGNIEIQTSDNTSNKNIVDKSKNNVINFTKYSKGNAKTKVGVESASAAVPSIDREDKSDFENTVCQKSFGLNKVVEFTSSSNDVVSSNRKLGKKQRKCTKDEFVNVTANKMFNEETKYTERKSTKKGTRELDNIHKDLNSMPQYSDIMKSGGPRTCRLKTKSENNLEENSNLKISRRSSRRTKPIQASGLSYNNSYNTSVSTTNNNSCKGNIIQVVNMDLEGAQNSKSKPRNGSDTSTCSVKPLVRNQEIKNTHEDSLDIVIVDVFSLSEENNVQFVREEINEEDEFVNIAKHLLAEFEEDLFDKTYP